MHDCRKIEERLVDLIFGELGEDQQAQMLAELADCQPCRAEYQSLKATLATFDKAAEAMLPDEPYWRGYESRLQAKLAAAEPVKRWQRWVEFAQGMLLRPAWAMPVSALLLMALLLWFLNKPATRTASELAKQNDVVIPADPSTPENDKVKETNIVAGKSTDVDRGGKKQEQNKSITNRPAGKPRAEQMAKVRMRKEPAVERQTRASEFSPDVSISEVDYLVRTLADDTTVKHFEKAQNLLRAFRNLNVKTPASAGEIADEKNRSRSLLLRNVLLRREAETRGNLPVQEVLSDLEPLLIDIAHLPEKSPQREIRAIRERIQRKEMIGKLQVYAARPVIAKTTID